MRKKLSEYNEGEELDLIVLIRDSQLRKTKHGDYYLALTFADSSAALRGNYWDADQNDRDRFAAGQIVELNGRLGQYQGKPQVKIYSLRPVASQEGYSRDDFIKAAPENAQQMADEISDYVLAITNPTWNRIVRYLLQKWRERFYSFPAAKSNHHAVRSGLAFHTLSMLRDAKGLADNYPQVDRSLLYAGCILHDMGKVIELSGPASTQYTRSGNLIGHLVLIDEQIVLAAQQLKLDQNSEDLLLLRHMVLAHHGQLDYGSPKRPALLEAELLHRIDDLDAAVYAITNALQHTRPGHFTDDIASQGNRRFYRPQQDQALTDSKNLE
jgi:3'-5' exoribonuclease